MSDQQKIVGEVFEVIEGSQETILYITIPAGVKIDDNAKIEIVIVEGDNK